MLFSKSLWSSYSFTPLCPFPPTDSLVVTSSAQLSPHLCMSKSQVTRGHAVQSLPSVLAFTTYLELIRRAHAFARHQHLLWCDFPPIIPRTLPPCLRLAQSVQHLFARPRPSSQPALFSPSVQRLCLCLAVRLLTLCN